MASHSFLSIQLSSFLIKSKALPSERDSPAIVWAPWVTWFISGGRRRHCHSICAPTIESDAFIYLFFFFFSPKPFPSFAVFQFPYLKKQKNNQNVHRSRKGVLGWLFCLFIYFFVVFFIPCEREKIHQVQQTRERKTELKLLISSLAL